MKIKTMIALFAVLLACAVTIQPVHAQSNPCFDVCELQYGRYAGQFCGGDPEACDTNEGLLFELWYCGNNFGGPFNTPCNVPIGCTPDCGPI